MAEHTPTPWAVEDDAWFPWEGAIAIVGDNDKTICFTPSGGPEAANAAFIVKAVPERGK